MPSLVQHSFYGEKVEAPIVHISEGFLYIRFPEAGPMLCLCSWILMLE